MTRYLASLPNFFLFCYSALKAQMTRIHYLPSWVRMGGFAFLIIVGSSSSLADSLNCLSPKTKVAIDKAVEGWSERTKIGLSDESKNWLIAESCQAMKDIREERPSSYSRLEELLPNSIVTYLQEQADPEAEVRKLGAILRSGLGASGLFRPGTRYLTKIEILFKDKNKIAPDEVVINGESRPSNQREIFVTPGATKVVVKLDGRVLCSLTLTVKAGEFQIVKCGF